jgi:DNA-binding LacI/PurR family transcriptional regulator
MMLNGKLNAYASMERLRGFREAMGDAFKPESVHHGDYSEQKSIAIMERLLSAGHFEYDAIVCSNDMMAIGAIKVLTSRGYLVGKDIDVTGFDNIIISQYIATPLTTVNQDKQLMGRSAMMLLMDIINEKATEMKIILPYSIIYRATT